MRWWLWKNWLAAKKKGTTNHTRASVYFADTQGISDVIDVKAIHASDASSSSVTGWRSTRMS